MSSATSQPVVRTSALAGSGGFSRSRRLWSRFMDVIEPGVEWLIRICGWSAIFFVLAIFVFVFAEGAPVLGHLNLKEFFTSDAWRPTSQVREQYGILALVAGTLSVTGVAMLIAVPFGLGAAVYISEFSTGKVKETLKIVIEMLAAIPSVVWGFIGYMVMGPLIIKATGAPVGVNVLNGGIILALMSVPVIVSVSEDALRAVPDSYREAAIALGASKWEIVSRVLFPAAKSGLLAAVLLGVGRSFGETMAVLMATGHAVQIPHSVVDPVRTLTATVAAELGEAVRGDDHYRVLFVIGIVLFAFVFVVNVTADLIVKGIRGRQHD
jgi:phosphate transport system permease protein